MVSHVYAQPPKVLPVYYDNFLQPIPTFYQPFTKLYFRVRSTFPYINTVIKTARPWQVLMFVEV